MSLHLLQYQDIRGCFAVVGIIVYIPAEDLKSTRALVS
jgi:hypothetical protein